jgi:hypothetical protein
VRKVRVYVAGSHHRQHAPCKVGGCDRGTVPTNSVPGLSRVPRHQHAVPEPESANLEGKKCMLATHALARTNPANHMLCDHIQSGMSICAMATVLTHWAFWHVQHCASHQVRNRAASG